MEHQGEQHPRPRRGPYTAISDEMIQSFGEAMNTGRVSVSEAAEDAGIPLPSAYRIWRAIRLNGAYDRKKKGVKPSKLSPAQKEFLKIKCEQNPKITLEKLRTALTTEDGVQKVQVCPSTIARALEGYPFTLKLITATSERSDAPEVWNERVEFARWFTHCQWMSGKIIFIDEAGFKVSSHRRYGQSKHGTPWKCTMPNLRSRNITTIAAITSSEMLDFQVLEGACDATQFNRFIQAIIEKIHNQEGMDSSVFVMDNVRFRHNQEVGAMIANAGHSIKYLPDYTPFFNPTENAFAAWKNGVNKETPHSDEELAMCIGNFRRWIPREHCMAYFQHTHNMCLQAMDGNRNLNDYT